MQIPIPVTLHMQPLLLYLFQPRSVRSCMMVNQAAVYPYFVDICSVFLSKLFNFVLHAAVRRSWYVIEPRHVWSLAMALYSAKSSTFRNCLLNGIPYKRTSNANYFMEDLETLCTVIEVPHVRDMIHRELLFILSSSFCFLNRASIQGKTASCKYNLSHSHFNFCALVF